MTTPRALVRIGYVWFAFILIPGLASQAQIPGRSVNMVAGTEWPGGDPFLQRQNEPSCAVSSGSPWRILCVANDYRTVDLPGLPTGGVIGDAWLGVFLSFDGGNRWQSTLLPGYPQDTSPAGLDSPLWGFQAAADPVVRAAHNRLFYLSGLVFDRGEQEPAATFVARFIDLNNKEGAAFDIVSNAAPIRYLDAERTFFARAGRFTDKPWLAVDVPRAGAEICHLEIPQDEGEPIVQEFAGGNVYQTFSVFQGDEEGTLAKLMFTRSTDCGETWSKPKLLSAGHHISQGSVIAIDPLTGDVYVAWRRFAFEEQTDALLIAKSVDGGRSFTRATEVAEIDPFEQGTSPISFRTTMFPAMAVDAVGRVYVASSERVGPGGDGRVVVRTSTDGGFTWSESHAVDNPMDRRGHQFMPSLLFHKGALSVLYYGQFLDHTYGTLVCPGTCTDISEFVEVREPAGDLASGLWWKVFNQCMIEVAPDDPACNLALGWDSLERRHTLDVFVARGEPAAIPAFDPPVRVSNYPFGSRQGSDMIEQLQFSPPILPLFQLGTVAFIGDYIDLAGASSMIPDRAGGWSFNTEPTGAWLAYGVWTSNQDVRPPPDGDWTTYTPPAFATAGTSLFDPEALRPACEPGRAGMRNQNIYMARISNGLVVGAMQNSKPLGVVPNPDPDPGEPATIPIQRTFVMVVQNLTLEVRHFRLTILDPAPGVQASLLQFDSLTELEVSVASKSSASRSVFVIAPDDPAASVTVLVQEIADVGGGLPPVPGGLEDAVVLNPDPTAPDITNPDITNPDITNPDITNAEVYNPDITNPDITNPDITNPDITNPDITNPDITNPDITNGAITDATWTVTNNGNTSVAYDVNLLMAGQVPTGFKLQMILHKIYSTPVVMGCELVEEAHSVLVASIPSPALVSDPADIGTIDPTNPDITNATLPLAPGESGKITLRVVDPDRSDDTTAEEFLEDNAVAPVAVSQSVDTEAAADALFEGAPPPPPVSTLPLTIVTTALTPAVLGVPFSETLQAMGGVMPYQWSLVAGTLPPGLALDPTSGLISGSPLAPGASAFTVQAIDAHDPPNVDSQSLTLLVTAPDLVVESLSHHPAAPTTEDLISFTAVVRNLGDAAAGPSTLMFKIGGETPGEPETLFALPPLAAGASFTVERQQTLTIAQSYLNTAQIDYDEEVIESEEANNVATDSYAVQLHIPGPTTPPDFLMQWGEGGTEEGQFNFAWGIAAGPAGEIYVVEASNHRVQKFDGDGNFERLWGWGVATGAAQFEICTADCQQGISGDGAGQFLAPRGVAVDTLGNVYVVDESNHRIQIFNADGEFLEAWGWGVATGANAYETCTADCQQGLAGAGEGQFFNPHGIAIDPANNDVLVAGTNMGRVQRFTSDGVYLEMYGWGINGITFSFTAGTVVDAAGNLYVTDIFNHRVVKIGPAGDLLLTWGNLGSGPGEFNEPHGIALDLLGRVYVAERGNDRIQVFDADGNFILSWGSPGSGPGEFTIPSEIAINDFNEIFVTDHTNRIQKFGFTGSIVPAGTTGYWRFEEGAPDALALGADSIVDSSLGSHPGDAYGGPVYRGDIPGGVIPLTGASNSVSLEFDGVDDEVGFDSTFPLHEAGDATIEFWLKIVGAGHRALFWTRTDDADTNRFNFYVHDGHFGFDYRSPDGTRHVLVDHLPGEMVWIGYDTWAHVAIARSGNEYRLYVDGALRRTAVDASPDLPISVGWQIAGREGYRFQGNLDELRFVDRAVDSFDTLINRRSIHIEAEIDGISHLTLRANTAQWHHLTWRAPGRFDFAVEEPTVINAAEWFPTWPDDPDTSNFFCDCDSDVFSGVVPPLPSAEWTVTLREIAVRDSVSVVQQPTPENGYALVIEFNDDISGGESWYIIEVDLPEP